jgi:CubicO group peptidase (beta-lactamase class C family)
VSPRDSAIERVHDIIDTHLARQVPGAAVAVVRGGEPIALRCAGLADLEWQCPVTPTTVFRLASLSKPFTALTTALLADDGLLDLDTPITEYLTGYPPQGRHITVRHLLTHTSGIPNFVTQPGFRGGTSRIDHADEDVLALFATKPLDFAPGSRYGYSNSGYRLLDILINHVTGRPFADVLTERVCAPAGMANTRVLTDENIVAERARDYWRSPDGLVNAPYVSMTLPGGAGGIGSTLEDLLRFDAALRDGAFADPALRHRLWSPVALTSGAIVGYGLGWGLSTYRGHRIVHHAGGIEGFSCLYLRLPDDDTSMIMLTNLELFPCAAPARRLVNTLLAPWALAPPIPVDIPQAVIDARTGTYANPVQDFTVTARAGVLEVTLAEHTHRMFPLGPNEFVDENDADIRLRWHDTNSDDMATLHYPLWSCTGWRADDR